MSTLTIVLIVVGVLTVLLLGTCGVSAVLLGRKAKEVRENILDGGLVLVAPEEVRAELAGSKKEYIGSWTSSRGSSLDIDADGNIKWVKDEGGSKQTITAVIGAFSGNDIVIKLGLDLKIVVSEPPHRVADHWEMTADRVTLRRSEGSGPSGSPSGSASGR